MSRLVPCRLSGRRVPLLVGMAFLALCALMLALSACNLTSSPGTSGSSTPPASTPTSSPFAVTGVDLSVSPSSIASTTCGSSASFTYTATFHVPSHSTGGVIQFAYTLNNGRSQTNASVSVAPGASVATYTFASSGTLSPDHTYPGTAIVMVTSPTHITSPAAKPDGQCGTQTGAFQVTAVDMAVDPASIAGKTCGTSLTVTYTATFHLAPSGPGGTIQFTYTVNNGRGSQMASISVPPNQTTATYQFNWSGALPADHTYPEPGGVMVQSPNTITSPLIGPSGTCS